MAITAFIDEQSNMNLVLNIKCQCGKGELKVLKVKEEVCEYYCTNCETVRAIRPMIWIVEQCDRDGDNNTCLAGNKGIGVSTKCLDPNSKKL